MRWERPDEFAAAREILTYVMEHPDSMDTIEGILKWWLPPSVEWGQDAVDAALAGLVRKGWMERSQLSDGRIAYMITKRGRPEGARFLRETKERSG